VQNTTKDCRITTVVMPSTGVYWMAHTLARLVYRMLKFGQDYAASQGEWCCGYLLSALYRYSNDLRIECQ
jgi:hypothetical protein